MARKSGSHSEITGPLVRSSALRLFARDGYAAVSMRQIAAEVGVQAGALYLYTPDKQTLLFDLMREHMDELLAAWDKNENGLWEPIELQAYKGEVERLKEIAETDATMPRWYFMAEDAVYGPGPLTRVTGKRKLPPWLVRYGRKTGWVRFSDVMR